mmetsp:Transcript_14417/g.25064  ORF Transcript_14417/g.25064 Transcript_14417/m.25064 type:complete len:113 (-) Transcript_14417:9-347(-)
MWSRMPKLLRCKLPRRRREEELSAVSVLLKNMRARPAQLWDDVACETMMPWGQEAPLRNLVSAAGFCNKASFEANPAIKLQSHLRLADRWLWVCRLDRNDALQEGVGSDGES